MLKRARRDDGCQRKNANDDEEQVDTGRNFDSQGHEKYREDGLIAVRQRNGKEQHCDDEHNLNLPNSDRKHIEN